MKSPTLLSFAYNEWSDVENEVEKILNGPSAIVSKATRFGFTTSAAKYASEHKKRLLIVKPTNKISETIKRANSEAITIYGHSHCALVQEENDDLMMKLPLSLPATCPRGPEGCTEYPECDLTRSWFESSSVRDITYAKLSAIAYSNPFVKESESSHIKEQLKDVDIIIFDESHEISLEDTPSVSTAQDVVNIISEYSYLFDVQQNFLRLKHELLIEEQALDSLDTIRAENKLSDKYLTLWYNNTYIISDKTLICAISELRAVAKRRANFNLKDDEVLHLYNMLSLMSCPEITLNLVTTSKGNEYSFRGRPSELTVTRANAIKRFLRDICPSAKVFFVSGTQFEKRVGFFEDIAQRSLEKICVKDIKSTNSRLTIVPSKWSYSPAVIRGKSQTTGNVKRAKQEILEVLEKHPNEPVYIVCFNIALYQKLWKLLKKDLPEDSIIDYYRSPQSIGVACKCRIGFAVGIASIPTNACDFATNNVEESQSLRLQSMHSATWQAWSRIKDPEGKEESILYCVGVRADAIESVVRQGSERIVTYDTTKRKNKAAISVREELPRPNIMQEAKTKTALEPRKCSVDDYLGVLIPIDERLKESLSSSQFLLSSNKNQLFYNIYYICKRVGKYCLHSTVSDSVLDENFALLSMLVVSRIDKCGLQHKRAKYDAIKRKYVSGYCTESPRIPFEDLLMKHLKCEETIALPPFNTDNICLWCAADFDDHDGNTPRTEDVKAFNAFLLTKNIPYFVLSSGSHTGHHVWILLEPTDTYTAYKFIRQLIHDAPIPNKEHIDLYPANKKANTTKRTVKGYGSQLKLPCAYNWKAKKRSQFVDPVTLEPVDHIEITHVLRLKQVQDEIPIKKHEKNTCKERVIEYYGEIRSCLLEAAMTKQLTGREGNDTRVALATDAVASGLEREEIIDLFRSQADFDYEKSSYYVDFAMLKKYNRWRCDTIADRCSQYINCEQCPRKRSRQYVSEGATA